jgi:hypothetical protein
MIERVAFVRVPMAVRHKEGTSKRANAQLKLVPALRALDALGAPAGQQVWRGASGTVYPHAVTSLVFCPEISEGTYLLIHRDETGGARVLAVGTLDSQIPTLNLAHIRKVGATLGANEVHYHSERTSPAERARIAFDIENALASDRTCAASAADCGAPQPA